MISESKNIIYKIEQLNANELRILARKFNEEQLSIKALNMSQDKLSLFTIELVGE